MLIRALETAIATVALGFVVLGWQIPLDQTVAPATGIVTVSHETETKTGTKTTETGDRFYPDAVLDHDQIIIHCGTEDTGYIAYVCGD